MELWESIVHFYHSTRRPVNVIVAYNADAAAAASTFISLFRSSLITFNVHPVANYDEVKNIVRDVNEANEFGSMTDTLENRQDFTKKELFLLIGLGASVELRSYFDLACHMVVVLDSYRPFHLDNLRNRDNGNLHLWDVTSIVEQVNLFFVNEQKKEWRQRRKRHRHRAKASVLAREYVKNKHSKRRRSNDACSVQTKELSHSDVADTSSKRQKVRSCIERNEENSIASINSNDFEFGDVNNDDDDDDDDDTHDGENIKESEADSDDSTSFHRESSINSTDYDSSESSDYSNDETSGDDNVDDDNDDSFLEDSNLCNWEDENELPKYMEQLYYATEGAGTSCAVAAYELAMMLNRYKDVYLWHAAVGVCDLFRRRLIDYSTYLIMMRPLHDAVTLQSTLRRQEVLNDLTNTSHLERANDNNGYGSNFNNSSATRRRLHSKNFASTSMKLENRHEIQLFLLRHCSLWDAIWLEPFVASVLKLHHAEEGKGFLAQLLASQCGVSLEMARKPWREWRTDIAQEVLQRVQAVLERLLRRRISETQQRPNVIRTIVRMIGFSTPVSAFDACTLFEAVLASIPPASLFTVECSSTQADESELYWTQQQNEVNKRVCDFRRQQFWKAFAVIDVDSNELLFNESAHEALALHRSVAQATAALMQPGIVQSTKGIHYALPNDPNKTISSLEQFNSVYRLAVLARRLLWTLTVERGVDHYSRHVRPLLLCCATPKLRKVFVSSQSNATIYSHPSLMPSTASVNEPFAEQNNLWKNRYYANTTIRNNTNANGNDCASKKSDNIANNNADSTRHFPFNNSVDNTDRYMCNNNTSLTSSSAMFPTEEAKYVVMLVHEGATQSNLVPLPSLGRFYQCITDEEEFALLPERTMIDRNCVHVRGRENTMHVAEVMHLISLEPWRPSKQQQQQQQQQQRQKQKHEDEEKEHEQKSSEFEFE